MKLLLVKIGVGPDSKNKARVRVKTARTTWGLVVQEKERKMQIRAVIIRVVIEEGELTVADIHSNFSLFSY